MKPTIEWTEHTPEAYRSAVEQALRTSFGETVESLHADTVVRAAQQAGLSPYQCVQWLARIHQLTARPRPRPPGIKPPSP